MSGFVRVSRWWPPLAIATALLLLAGCDSAPPPVDDSPPGTGTAEPTPVADNGLSPEQRQDFYHLSQGADLLPLRLFLSLENPRDGRPFHESLEQFGFLPDPESEHCLPVGLVVTKPVDVPFQMVGFNCALCHVGEVRYQGERLRIDGAPNFAARLFDFQNALAEAVQATLSHPVRAWHLLERLDHGPVDACSYRPEPIPETAGLSEDEIEAHRRAVQEELEGARTRDEQHRWVAHAVRHHGRHPERMDAGHPGFREKLRLVEARMKTARRYFHHSDMVQTTPAGPGRADAWGAVRNMLFEFEPTTSPQDIPTLYQFEKIEWLHWTANTTSSMQRNLAEALAFGAVLDPKTGWTEANLENLHRIEMLARQLEPPVWPEMLPPPDAAAVARGRGVFEAHCAGCHEHRTEHPDGLQDYLLVPLEEIGVDPHLVRDYNRPLAPGPRKPADTDDFVVAMARVLEQVEDAYIADRDLDPSIRQQWQQGRDTVRWRSEVEGYVARSLHGLWSSPPYLHNGSVPTVADLLEHPDCARHDPCRPERFAVGHREIDPERLGLASLPLEQATSVFDTALPGNSNAGHEHGLILSSAEKSDLIEYLKTY